MSRKHHRLPIALAALVSCTTAARAGDQPVVTTDLLRIRTVSDIDVSADGTKTVFAVKSIAEAKPADVDDEGEPVPPEYEYRSHLFLIDLDRNGGPVQLTFGKRNDHSPQFAPDGRSVVFVRSSPDDDPKDEENEDEAQVWLLPLSGGEARPLTDFKHGAEAPLFSPDGARVLVASEIPFDEMEGAPSWPHERPKRDWSTPALRAGTHGSESRGTVAPRPDGTREEIRAWLAQNELRENPSVFNRLNFQDERKLQKPYEFRQLFLIDLAAMTEEPVASEDVLRITSDFADHEDAFFMPDGRRIIYAAKKPSAQHPDRVRRTDLWMVNADGTNDRAILASPDWSFSAPRPSLDGTVIAFTAQQTDEPAYRQDRLGMISAGSEGAAEPLWLTDAFDTSVDEFEWMSARGAIIFNAPVRGNVPLFSISTGLLEPKVLTEGAQGVTEFDVGGGTVVFAQTSPASPCTLRAITPRGERLLYDLNPWIAEKALSTPDEGWIDRPDGARVQYWIMPPTNLLGGQKYPLVVPIHGGPAAMWGPGEASMWHEFQLLCSWGYGVVYCNPRGSGGYGYEFQKANHQNWSDGPAGDVLAACDRALQLPWVDSNRLVIAGGSYAGYLTAWIIANDHRFKAAVAQRGVYDLTTFFGEGNAWRMIEDAFGGYPWQSNVRTILQRESPFTHVARIRTPLLIMHASDDLRTGVSQSEMLYRALKVLEKPVEYVRYPDAGHDLSRTGDPYQRMDRLNRIIEFFERHIKNDRPAPILPDALEAPSEERSDAGSPI